MEPFIYPQMIHRRTQTPPKFKRYQSYKKYLKVEFENKCIYCRMPDGLKGEASFGVEHYKPSSKFKDLECTYSNLYYCCNTCNSNKGNFWPSVHDLIKKLFVPNPCDHVMVQHLKYVHENVESKSDAGAFCIELLRLNEESIVDYRKCVIDAIKLFNKELSSLKEDIIKFEKIKIKLNDKNQLDEIKSAINETNENIEIVNKHIKRLTGK